MSKMPNTRKTKTDESVGKKNDNKSTTNGRANCDRMAVHSNKSKQIVKKKKSHENDNEDREPAKISKLENDRRKLKKVQKTTAVFNEEDEEVMFEVEGQDSEFYSNANDTETDEDDEIIEDGEIIQDVRSMNNNAVKDKDRTLTLRDFDGVECDSRADSVKDPKELVIEPEEEEFFNKWELFLKKRGLQITPVAESKEKKDVENRKTELKQGEWKKEGKESLVNPKRSVEYIKDGNSVNTIYEPAVTKNAHELKNRLSSSSEENDADLSDPKTVDSEDVELLINHFITDQHLSVEGRSSEQTQPRNVEGSMQNREPRPHCSQDEDTDEPRETSIQQRAKQVIRDAEKANTSMVQVPGKAPKENVRQFEKSLAYSHLVDDDYMMVASHLDDLMIIKIESGEYVDFGKLLPHDKVQSEEDHRMEMINRGGFMYWVPLSDREKTNINCLDH